VREERLLTAMGGAEEGGAGSPPPRCSLARQCHLHADGEEEEGVRRPPTDGREEEGDRRRRRRGGSPVKRKRRGQRKIGAGEGETENDEGGMGRAGSHRKGMLSGTYV